MKRLRLDGLPEFDRMVMTLAHNVVTSAKFRDHLQQQCQYDEAVSDLYFLIVSKRDTYQGCGPGYLVLVMKWRLYDFLKERSAAGHTEVPREVFKTPKKLEHKDLRRQFLEHFNLDSELEFFTFEGRDQNFFQLGLCSQDTNAELASRSKLAALANLEEQPDFQRLMLALNEKTVSAKARAMGCKVPDLERRMQEAYDRIFAFFHESMGRHGD